MTIPAIQQGRSCSRGRPQSSRRQRPAAQRRCNALIRRSPVPPGDCNLWKAFELIGDRWTLVILRSALYGVRRFDDFQNELDVPRSVLSNRLARLVENGLMQRRDYREDGQRARIEYPLTKRASRSVIDCS
ncbi:MAG: helix-turn-helix domain-containing protein [Afipia sp.]|nr:helix-turn-helix domain-containing protein [Afipia sp.]